MILIVGPVFRKALGDGKRAIILQPDWAKVSAGSPKTLPASSVAHWVENILINSRFDEPIMIYDVFS